jgi:hypothetical protein
MEVKWVLQFISIRITFKFYFFCIFQKIFSIFSTNSGLYYFNKNYRKEEKVGCGGYYWRTNRIEGKMTPTEYWGDGAHMEPDDAENAFWADPPPSASYGNDNDGTFLSGDCSNFSNLTSPHLKKIIGNQVYLFIF